MKWDRFIRAFIFVLAIVSALRGDALWAMAGFVSFFVTFLPSIVKRELNISLGTELDALIFLSLLLHLIGGVLNLYTEYNWDFITHFVSSVLIALIGLVSVYTIDRYADSIELTPIAVSFLVVSFTLASGVLWELGEFASDSLFGTIEQYSYYDTISDLITDLIGGLLVAVLAPYYIRSGWVGSLIDVRLKDIRLKEPNLHWVMPLTMAIFLIYFFYRGSFVSFLLSFMLLILSFYAPLRKVSSGIEALFFVALTLRFIEEVYGIIYSYPAEVVLIAFIASYVLDSLYGPSPWFLGFLVPMMSLFISAMVESLRFLGSFYASNSFVMMNFLYVLLCSVPAGIAVWVFYDRMDRVKKREVVGGP